MRFRRDRLILLSASLASCLLALLASAPGVAQQLTARTEVASPGCRVNCTISGVVATVVSPTKFMYAAWGPYGRVPVIYSGSSVVPSGSSIKVGQTAMVAGSFIAGQLIATRVTIFTLYHIATTAYDSYSGEGAGASPASVRQLLTFAEGGLGDTKATGDCHGASNGCKAIFYLKPNHEYSPSPSECLQHPDREILNAAPESWFMHLTGYSDSGHRIYGKAAPNDQGTDTDCTVWQMNPNSSGLQAWWRNYLRLNAANYDMLFLDTDSMDVADSTWFSSGGGCQPWPFTCHSTQEIPNDAAIMQAHANFVNAMTYSNGSPMHFFYQQAYPKRTLGLDLAVFARTKSFTTVSCEGCVANVASTVVPSNYAPYLDEMAAINATAGSFMVISDGIAPAGSATQILQRLVTTGIVWLAYSEGRTIVQPNLERNTNNLAIWPEDLIYPSDPLESMVLGSNDLQVAPGVYRREFARCYQRGVFFGKCAAVVNANASAITIRSQWLRQTYHHVITLSGGDVLSRGVANISGAAFVPGSTWVQPGGALMLAL